jgi:hypothetical protein
MVRKILGWALLGMVILDTLFSYFAWNAGTMEEENPFMLWALQHEPVYWIFKLFQIAAVIILMKLAVKNRFAFNASILALAFFVGIYGRVLFQMVF